MTADYYGFGFCFRSELALPDLSALPGAAEGPAVTIRFGAVEPFLAEPRHAGAAFQVNAEAFLLAVPNVARYRIRRGEEITIEPAAGATDRDLRVFLLGTLLGALCHQRGRLPLHASAVAVDGRCIVFAGASRAGKSTLAAALAHRGHAIWCDDVCVVSRDPAGRPIAWPGIARPKLWRDAVDAMNIDPEALEPTRRGLQKFYVSCGASAAGAPPLPVSHIYLLREAQKADKEGIERLTGTAAFDALINATYRRNLVKPMKSGATPFAHWTALVQHAQIHVARRCWGFDVLADSASRLERHFQNAGEAEIAA